MASIYTRDDFENFARIAQQAIAKAHGGWAFGEEQVQQLAVMLEALEVYEERDKVRRGLWREGGLLDSAHHLKSKAMRVYHYLVSHEGDLHASGHVDPNVMDDAQDAINFAVFFIRNERGT